MEKLSINILLIILYNYEIVSNYSNKYLSAASFYISLKFYKNIKNNQDSLYLVNLYILDLKYSQPIQNWLIMSKSSNCKSLFFLLKIK